MLVSEKKYKHFTIDDTCGDGEDISQPNDCFLLYPLLGAKILGLISESIAL